MEVRNGDEAIIKLDANRYAIAKVTDNTFICKDPVTGCLIREKPEHVVTVRRGGKTIKDTDNDKSELLPEKVVFSGAATALIFADGKEVLKLSEGDAYDPEKAIMRGILQHMMGKKELNKMLAQHISSDKNGNFFLEEWIAAQQGVTNENE